MPDLAPEHRLRAQGIQIICGIDEAGRGPLAGPVTAAAVILPDLSAPWGGLPADLGAAIDDSKRLRPKAREEIAAALPAYVSFGMGWASVAEIDTINILQAAMLAMSRAVAALPTVPDGALVDGNRLPALPPSCRGQFLIGGDGLSLSIAAASILAKVARDHLMTDLAHDFPGYGWEKNQGYGTAQHKKALHQLGPTPHHRRTFAPIADLFS